MLISTLKHLLRRKSDKNTTSEEANVLGVPAFTAQTGDRYSYGAMRDGAAGNPLLDYFIHNGGHVIHKWVDYFDVYLRVLERYRGRPIKLLEIGVQNGGSARMWRDYLGPMAQIIGVDVDPRCKALNAEGIEIWIGDQGDPDFWSDFCSRHPEIDVVIDDGGHTMTQQIVTFEALFPVLADGGAYICEDTHTSYFPLYGGGNKRPGTFHEYMKGLIDEMHAWYHAPLSDLSIESSLARNLYSLSFFDSIVVMEKRRKNPPLALARGLNGHEHLPPAMTFLDLRRRSGIDDEGSGKS